MSAEVRRPGQMLCMSSGTPQAPQTLGGRGPFGFTAAWIAQAQAAGR